MQQLIKNYQKNCFLRKSFNNLAQKTFGLQFETWYRNGFWRDCYIPYSIIQNESIIANVSVNVINMSWNGNRKHFIQLGTVMTEENYRHQGLIRRIMEEIEKDYSHIDGIYLFANDSVLDFYPKFGFSMASEFQCSKQIFTADEGTMLPVLMNNKRSWDLLENAIKCSAPQGCFEMYGNSELIMFYITGFMQNNVYYDKFLNAYAIAEIIDEQLFLYAIFAPCKIALDSIIHAFGNKIKKVLLGFTPECRTGYTITPLKEADTTLFIKGSGFPDFEREQLMFPPLTHA